MATNTKTIIAISGIITLLLFIGSRSHRVYKTTPGFTKNYCEVKACPITKTTREIQTDTIQKFLLKYNPNVADYAGDFVNYCKYHQVQPYLAVAIGSHESGYFRYGVDYNFYGITGCNGFCSYSSMREGIATICKLLGNSFYRGKTIPEIARNYAEDPTWNEKVQSIYQTIKRYEKLQTP